MQIIQPSSGTSNRRLETSYSFALVPIAFAMLGCAPPGASSPGRWHHDGWRPTPYIIDTWSGMTSKQTVFGFKDPEPFEIAVLEEVEGPDPGDLKNLDGRATRRQRSGRVEYLANANGKLLGADQVAPGLHVQVKGFQRAHPGYGKVFNPRANKHEIAQTRPFEPGPLLPMIKVKEVSVIEANGKKRLLWHTDVPFRDL